MPHESFVCIVVHVALGLQHGLNVAALLIELRGEPFGCKGLAQSKRVIDDGIHALDAVKSDEHKVQHLVVGISPVHPLEAGIWIGDLVPLAPVHQGDPDDAGGMHLMQRDRAVLPPLDDGIGIAPAIKPGIDAVPEIKLVGIGVWPHIDHPIGWMLRGIYHPIIGTALDIFRERSNVFRADSDAGIKGRHFQSGLIGDSHAKGGLLDYHIRGHSHGGITSP